ncbi:MAG TPA: hypothetical protein VEG34_06110 [Thermoanaerobaculia bacterium]|nr:hypothetical protein [Thermoanaerobaculia bacterium]
MRPLLPSQVAWYVTGRFYAADTGSILDVGYFLHLPGIDDGDLFAGTPGEATACFTFAAAPFTASQVSNGGLSLALDAVGEFGLYLNRRPAATFDDPQSFAAGEEIARFRRRNIVVGATVAGPAETAGQAGGSPAPPALISQNVFSAALLWSCEFEHAGRRHDLGRLLPHGITQWGTASAQPMPPPAGYSTSLPFVGWAVAVG